MKDTSTHKSTWISATVVVLVLISLAFLYFDNAESTIPKPLRGVMLNSSVALKNVDLIDHTGNKISLDSFKDQWTFVFFGYTHCPDVCPATVSQLAVVQKKISDFTAQHKKVLFYFVSVDPTRDTLKKLASYVNYFGSGFVGVTGSNTEIQALENQIGAYHRLEKEDQQGFYAVQHSAEVFLINPFAELVAKFQPPMATGQVANQFIQMVALQHAKHVNAARDKAS